MARIVSAQEGAVKTAGAWVEKLARFGYAARGTVYLLVGGLAVAAAFLAGRQVSDNRGALEVIAGQPFGKTMLAIVGLGLLCFALWRGVQAIKDPEHLGNDAKGMAARAGRLASGLLHASLAWTAWKIVTGSGSSGDQTQTYTARLMSQPFGRWMVIAAGLAVAALALREFYQAWSLKFMKRIRTWEMKPEAIQSVRMTGRLGHAARGVVFLVIGVFLTIAGWTYHPEQARGVEGALETLQRQSYGPWILALVGLGLVGYGLFQFVNARYRAISPNPLA